MGRVVIANSTGEGGRCSNENGLAEGGQARAASLTVAESRSERDQATESFANQGAALPQGACGACINDLSSRKQVGNLGEGGKSEF